MAEVYEPSRAYWPLGFGAIGGFLSALISLAVMIAATVYLQGTPQLAPNAIGASVVWWLQTADGPALDGLYWDATLGGALLFLGWGILLGAFFSGLICRLFSDRPVLWGLVLGFGLWAVTISAVGPSLNPVLIRALPGGVLLVTCLSFGLAMGAWVRSGRQVAPEI